MLALCSCLFILSLFNVIDLNLSKYLESAEMKEAQVERVLSLNLGGGNCEWQLPKDAHQENDLFSSLLVAFPGSRKLTLFMQFEGLTELHAGDDYDLNPDSLGKKFAFMKSNYPQLFY